MPHISISVPQTDSVLNYELSPDFSIGDLKSLINAETEFDIGSQTIFFNGTPLNDDAQTLEGAGVKDDDVLICTSKQPQPGASAAPSAQPSQAAQDDPRLEQIRQNLLTQVRDPRAREQFRAQYPQLDAVLEDPAGFHSRMGDILKQENEEASRIEARNNDWSAEEQAKIYEEIRQRNVEKEAAEIMEENPELFGGVTMLYINVLINGHPVKAFVDSGAQTTVMSPSCAEACEVTRMIDKRWGGIAVGVGTAKILGRVHRASMQIGDADDLPCSFTVMEGKHVDLLFGLDMLKRYQACIDLQKNRLFLANGTVSVPFLPESEIPKSFREAAEDEPTVPGPAGTSIGANTGTVKPTPSASTSASAPAVAQSSASGKAPKQNFTGQGHTLGAASGSASAPSTQPQPQQRPQQPPSQPAQPAAAPSSSDTEFPQSSIDLLERIGATREQAIDALRACDGNVDYAAGLLFDMR